MKATHYFSGLVIAIFVGVHILNHLTILHSESMHISFMQAARKIYRNPIIESLLLLAVLVQIGTGLALAFQKWGKITTTYDWIHVLSGLYMALFLIIHVSAVMIGRYRLQVDTNLWYGAGVMNMWPHKLFFIPYYTLALISFFFHVACIHRLKAPGIFGQLAAERHAIIIMILGTIVTAAIIIRMSTLRLPDEFIKATAQSESTRRD